MKSLAHLKLNRVHTITILILVVWCCGSCSRQNVNDGIILNNVYSNKFFGLEIEIPNGWQVINKNEKLNEIDTDNNYMTKVNPWIIEDIKSATSAFRLLTLQKDATKNSVGISFLCSAEKIHKSGPMISIYGYLKLVESQLSKINLGPHKLEISINKNPTFIDGRKFGILEVKMKLPNTVINQKYFVTLYERYALIFILTSDFQRPEKDFEEILSGIVDSNKKLKQPDVKIHK